MKRKTSTRRICLMALFNVALIFIGVVGIFLGLKYGFHATFDRLENIHLGRTSSTIYSMEITVDENLTVEALAEELFNNHIIVDKEWFILESKVTLSEPNFVEGTYHVTSTMSHSEIVDLLCTTQPVEPIRLTIPEGFTIEQIALRVDGTGVATEEEFLEAVMHHSYDYAFLEDIPEDVKYPLEGYLFPDTYFIYPSDSADDIIIRMLNQFEHVMSQYTAYLHDSPYTLHEIITIASIIEQEAKVADERAIISGVIYNRLNSNMPLQMCSTIQYALGVRKSHLSYEDLEINSPYNTYTNSTLPVGPISSVSEASIKAALMPKNHNYYYFVLKDATEGSHAFSTTAAEHATNKDRYLQSEDKNFID